MGGSEGQPEGSEGQPEGSEGQPGGSEGQPKGCEGQPEGSEGQPEGSEGQPEGSEGLPGGEGRMYVRNFSPFYRTSSPLGAAAQKKTKRNLEDKGEVEEQPHSRWRNLKFTRFLRKEAEESVKE